MPRIRYIKPGAGTDEHLSKLSFAHRWTFVMLPCHCDREGRCEDRPAELKLKICPYDDVDLNVILADLARIKEGTGQPFLIRYEIEGRRYIQVVNFAKHQIPHWQEAPSVIPPPPGFTSGKAEVPREKGRREPDKQPDPAGLSPEQRQRMERKKRQLIETEKNGKPRKDSTV